MLKNVFYNIFKIYGTSMKFMETFAEIMGCKKQCMQCCVLTDL